MQETQVDVFAQAQIDRNLGRMEIEYSQSRSTQTLAALYAYHVLDPRTDLRVAVYDYMFICMLANREQRPMYIKGNLIKTMLLK